MIHVRLAGAPSDPRGETSQPMPSSPRDAPPAGFQYRAEFLTPAEETTLLAALRSSSFTEVRMRGRLARRRTIHFGWLYGYESSRITPGPPIPDFFGPIRERAAALAGIAPSELVEALVNEYPPGAGIGWHVDAPQFGVVIGVSLLTPCRLRFQRASEDARDTRAAWLAPRSCYVLDGEARWRWRHMIPPQHALRYSITFRSLR